MHVKRFTHDTVTFQKLCGLKCQKTAKKMLSVEQFFTLLKKTHKKKKSVCSHGVFCARI